jgi:hypothetical protein
MPNVNAMDELDMTPEAVAFELAANPHGPLVMDMRIVTRHAARSHGLSQLRETPSRLAMDLVGLKAQSRADLSFLSTQQRQALAKVSMTMLETAAISRTYAHPCAGQSDLNMISSLPHADVHGSRGSLAERAMQLRVDIVVARTQFLATQLEAEAPSIISGFATFEQRLLHGDSNTSDMRVAQQLFETATADVDSYGATASLEALLSIGEDY